MMCSLAMNNLLPLRGFAAYGMVGITSGGLLNIVLDPILIFGLKLGTARGGHCHGRFPTGQLHHSAADDQSPCQRHFHQLEKLHPTAVIYKKDAQQRLPVAGPSGHRQRIHHSF